MCCQIEAGEKRGGGRTPTVQFYCVGARALSGLTGHRDSYPHTYMGVGVKGAREIIIPLFWRNKYSCDFSVLKENENRQLFAIWKFMKPPKGKRQTTWNSHWPRTTREKGLEGR